MLLVALLLLALYALIGAIILEVEIGDGVPVARALVVAAFWPRIFAEPVRG